MDDELRLIRMRPNSYGGWNSLCEEAGLSKDVELLPRYLRFGSLRAIVDARGIPVWAPTLFLVWMAVSSKGATDDAVRTYGECLIAWMRHLAGRNVHLNDVCEEDLQLYRAELAHTRANGGHCVATATANLRIAAVTQFHRWCHHNGFSSSLSSFLVSPAGKSRSLAPRVIRRFPKVLGYEEVRELMTILRPRYRLPIRWTLVTGMRRFEVLSLRCSALPRPEALSYCDDGLVKIDVLRKGGRQTTAYAPVMLVEETQWYILTERAAPKRGFEDHVFLNTVGREISRTSLSMEFKRCAVAIGSEATLHHLRHTYAVNVLGFLDKAGVESGEDAKNSLKTLQVLMGHESSESTELYLRAIAVTSSAVVGALDYLYGASV